MSEERTPYTTSTLTKLVGRGGPGRGQGAPRGNSNASKGANKRVKVTLTLAPTNHKRVKTVAASLGLSIGEMIDSLVESCL